MRRSRRAVLGACATGLAGVAGCLGGGDTEVDLGEAATLGGGEVRVDGAVVQESVFVEDAAGSLTVRTPGDRQYLFAEFEAEGGDIDPATLALVGDDRSVSGWTDYRLEPEIADGVYEDRTGTGWVGFRPPEQWVGERPRLRLAGEDGATVAWRLSDEVVERLRAPPASLRLDRWAPPEAVPADEPFELSVGAQNVGDGAGTFRFAVDYPYLSATDSDPGRLAVPPGESRTSSLTVDCHVGSEPRAGAYFRLRMPDDELNVPIDVT